MNQTTNNTNKRSVSAQRLSRGKPSSSSNYQIDYATFKKNSDQVVTTSNSSSKLQLKLSSDKIALRKSQLQPAEGDVASLRRKSAPNVLAMPPLLSFTINPKQVVTVAEITPLPKLLPPSGGGGGGGGSDGNSSETQRCESNSPESLVDKVLSAASSVSVQSVSSASNTTVAPIALLSSLPIPNTLQPLKVSPELRICPPTPDALQTRSPTLSPLPSPLPSPSPSITLRVTPAATPEPFVTFPDDLKCGICMDVYTDPRTLHCLHSFCYQCLVDGEDFRPESMEPEVDAGNRSNYSLRSGTPEMSPSMELATVSPARQRGSNFTLRRKKSIDRKPKGVVYLSAPPIRTITCHTCKAVTQLPLGGVRQLPQNFLLVRRIEALRIHAGEEVISRVWCSLCSDESSATYHCITCTLNLCTLCKDAHERQRSTATHRMKNIMELRRARKNRQQQQLGLGDSRQLQLKCGVHPNFELKTFCSDCLQLACADCLVLLHKGHKHENVTRAIAHHGKILREATEKTRPLCNYAEQSIERLNDMARIINRRCDEIQEQVENHMQRYFDALEAHRRTLLQQVHRARESKVEMILEQQLDLEQRTQLAVDAMRFSQELCDIGADVEILSFTGILLRRLEFCQQFKPPVDPKISDSLHFLPKIRAPATKDQKDIPLYGIITMQTVEPSLCTLQWEGFSELRLHRKVELLLLSRDADGMALCHGGVQINCIIKYKEANNTKFLPIEVSDHRDGTYTISFTPDAPGTLLLTVSINDKPIKGTPFTFQARQVRPHSGIYHCCAFCSSKGNRLVKCSCEGRMPGYSGCGHGHAGHPGRRHWSCCGNVLENSECNVANKLLNT